MKAVIDDSSVNEPAHNHIDWFVFLASVNSSLRITPGVILGVDPELELCFSLQDAAHAVTFFYEDEKLFVQPEVGELWLDEELISQQILVEPDSTFYLGEVPLFVTTSPVLKNAPPARVNENQHSRTNESRAPDLVVKESAVKRTATKSPGAANPSGNVVRIPTLTEPVFNRNTVAEPPRAPKNGSTSPIRLLRSGLVGLILGFVVIKLAPMFWEEPAPADSGVLVDTRVKNNQTVEQTSETLPSRANINVPVDGVAAAPDAVVVDAVVEDPVTDGAAVEDADGGDSFIRIEPDVVASVPDKPVASPVPVPTEAPLPTESMADVTVAPVAPVPPTEVTDIPATPTIALTKESTTDTLLTNPSAESQTQSPTQERADTLLPIWSEDGTKAVIPDTAKIPPNPAYAAIEEVDTEHLLVAAQWALRNGDGPGALILLEAITSKSPDNAQAIALRDQVRRILAEVELNNN